MRKKQLVVWGASGHALVVTDIVRRTGEYEIVGYIDDVAPNLTGKSFCGKPIWTSAHLPSLRAEGVNLMFVGVGDCEARVELSRAARKQGFELATLRHPSAVVALEVALAPGALVAATAVVGAGARIGEDVIINTGATVDHECVIAQGVHISPGAHLGGRVEVGEATWIGLGANVKDKVRIGAHSIVGAGALVLKDIPDRVTAYGVPARVVGKRTTLPMKETHA